MSGLSAEERYRLLAAAVDRMPDTCDEECSSHGHSRACGEREAALPAAEIVRLSARVDALQQERDEYKELWREQAWRVDELDKRRDALAARVRELEHERQDRRYEAAPGLRSLLTDTEARVRELEDALREIEKWLSDANPQMVEYDHGVPYDVVGCALESARAALAPTRRPA